MTDLTPSVAHAYKRLQGRFSDQMLGLVEIGSHARGEAVSVSDHDTRLVIRTDEPFILLHEHAWTSGITGATRYLDWNDLNGNGDEEVSFGLTNLGYIERGLQIGCFPVNDHTCLYQGHILVDPTGQITSFRKHYAGIVFSNVVTDYVRQTDWRVNTKLPLEAYELTFMQHLDHRKYAIPLIHTCCRILRDLANIDSYRRDGNYLADMAALNIYYQRHWERFYGAFRTLFAYKTDEVQRRHVFAQAARRDSACLAQLRRLQHETASVWHEFKAHIAQ
jgi:hypothetical protein